MKVEIKAYVVEVRGNRAGDRSEKLIVGASYEAAGLLSSISFEIPVEQAKEFYVGQELVITISN